MKVYLIGIGMGNPETATVQAVRAIESADLLIGAQRMLDAFPQPAAAQRIALTRAEDIVAALEAARAAERGAAERTEPQRGKGGAAQDGRAERVAPAARTGEAVACVLFSGDVGFYSGAGLLYDRLEGFDVTVLPGVSSAAYLCAKACTPWHDAFLVSAHGRAGNVAGAVQSHAKTFAIAGGATRVQDICAELADRGLGGLRAVAGERMSYPDERIVDATAADLARETFGDLASLLVLNPHPVQRAFGAPSLSDACFQRAKVPMTKEEVRDVAIAKLRIAPASLVWDVGAGTGSVSVEAALACPAGRVLAVERNPEACELVRRNASRLGAFNVEVVQGEAPRALAALPAPDRVFIGGSGGKLEGVVRAALSANPRARIVLTALTLETLSAALRAFSECGLPIDDIVQLSVARAHKAGGYHLMQAQNPVYLIAGQARVEGGA